MATLVDSIGIANNLDEPQPILNRKAAIIGIVISFMIVAWICALGRFYVRFRVIKSPWWDDLFVLLSSVSKMFSSLHPPLTITCDRAT